MYMPAEPKLLEYAYRVKQDVPLEADVVKFEKMKPKVQGNLENNEESVVIFDKTKSLKPNVEFKLAPAAVSSVRNASRHV